jgi:hypothetical protein
MMAQLWRDALAAHPHVHVIANADDPMVVYAAAAHAAGGPLRATPTTAGGGAAATAGTGPGGFGGADTAGGAGPAGVGGGTAGGPAGEGGEGAVPAAFANRPAAEALTGTATGALLALDEAAPSDAVPSDAAAALAAGDAAPVADDATTGATTTTDSVTAAGPAAASAPDAPVSSGGTSVPALTGAAGSSIGGPSASSIGGTSAAALSGAGPTEAVSLVGGDTPVPGSTGGVTWFSAGQRWRDDAHVCPACGAHIEREDDGDGWWCTACDLRRPAPDWTIDGSSVIDPTGARHELKLQLPGKVNVGNAATALAVAHHFGVRPADAAPKLAEVTSVAGRYAQVSRDGRDIRLLLAKNPASWLEAFEMAENAPTLLSINARDPDGFDTSWLFDVDFAPLRGRRVVITGDRAYDLAVRLQVNDVSFVHVRSFSEALAAVPAGPLEVIANYTAFQDIRAELDRVV